MYSMSAHQLPRYYQPEQFPNFDLNHFGHIRAAKLLIHLLTYVIRSQKSLEFIIFLLNRFIKVGYIDMLGVWQRHIVVVKKFPVIKIGVLMYGIVYFSMFFQITGFYYFLLNIKQSK